MTNQENDVSSYQHNISHSQSAVPQVINSINAHAEINQCSPGILNSSQAQRHQQRKMLSLLHM